MMGDADSICMGKRAMPFGDLARVTPYDPGRN